MPRDLDSRPSPLAQAPKAEAALWWANMGIPVFPVFGIQDGKCECGGDCGKQAGKHPNHYLAPHGHLDATTDEDLIRLWWAEWPDSNIGGATGDGVVVIDIDSDVGESTIRMYGEPPETLEVRTGRGRHLYYVQPDLEIDYRSTRGGTASGLGDGVDTRGSGGYVILAGSTHASGATYDLVYREPVELPEVLAEILSAPAPTSGGGVQTVDADGLDVPHRDVTPQASQQFRVMLTTACERIANTRPGGSITRHDRILSAIRSVAGYYHMQSDMGIGEVFAFIDLAVERCYEGEDRKVAGGQRTARDAWRDGLQNPYPHMPGQLATTPDGRPYLVAHDARRGLWVATSDERGCGFAWTLPDLVTARLRVEWPGIVLWTPKADGSSDKPMNWLDAFGRYGDQFASGVEFAYEGSSTFDESRGVIRISPRFADPPKAVFNEEIARWLELLPARSEDHDKLLDWLATAPRLDSPTSALVLTRKGSVGKQLIAMALAEYFGVRPVSYDVAVQKFNVQLTESPIVWLDETTDAQSKSADFRRLVANSQHRIEIKNGPSGVLLGHPRVYMAANNDDPTGIANETLTIDDEDAIAERLLHIPVSIEAALYLKRLGGRDYTSGKTGPIDWVVGLAQHIRWLYENREVTPGSKLLVQGDAAKWVREVGARHGAQAELAELIGYEVVKARRGQVSALGEPPVFVDPDGAIYASVRGIKRVWEPYYGERSPKVTDLRKALQRLCRVMEPVQKSVGGKRHRMYPVPHGLIPEFDVDPAVPQGSQ